MAKKQKAIKRRKSSKNSSLILFSIPGCPACVELKKVLKKEKVKYRDVNCNKPSKLADSLGVSQVPILYIKFGKDYYKIGKDVSAAKEALSLSKRALNLRRRKRRLR